MKRRLKTKDEHPVSSIARTGISVPFSVHEILKTNLGLGPFIGGSKSTSSSGVPLCFGTHLDSFASRSSSSRARLRLTSLSPSAKNSSICLRLLVVNREVPR